MFRYISVSESELINTVVARRIDQIRIEVGVLFPGAVITHSIDPEGRGVISVTFNDCFLSQEFVETAQSLEKPERSLDYLRVLRDKMRLVLVVPESKANRMRLKMLQFNHWWLFYYLIFSYDEEGNIRKVGRPQPIGSPSDEGKGLGFGNG
jgi:hypothetical protein